MIAMYKQNLKNYMRHKKSLDDESLTEIDPHMLRQLQEELYQEKI